MQDMKKNIGSIIVTLAIGGLAVSMAWADIESVPATIQGGTLSGVGTYTGFGKYTVVHFLTTRHSGPIMSRWWR
jgi:hypothetical protein